MTVGLLPIKPVVLPADIVALNQPLTGYLPDSMLVQVGERGFLHHAAARAYNALAFKCLAIGLPLTYDYGGCYRDFAGQEQLFRQRYSPSGTQGGCRVWNGTTWCKVLVNGRVPASAAVPGTSNHGLGLAIDTAFDSNPGDGISPKDATEITSHPQWEQFKQFALDCGFSWEDTSEPWHIRLVTGDTPTQAVLDVEAFIFYSAQAAASPAGADPASPPVVAVSPAAAANPAPPPPAPVARVFAPVARIHLGGMNVSANVVALQNFCNFFGWHSADGRTLAADGNYGNKSAEAVKAMQVSLKIVSDGDYGNQSQNALQQFLDALAAMQAAAH